MIKSSSSFILEEFALIINETIEHFGNKDQIKNIEQKEALKFELTALVFWFFQKTDMFPEFPHKLLLDEIHKQYYDRLRKHSYDFKMRQIVTDDFNLRYKTYNEALGKDKDLTKVGIKFVYFLSNRLKRLKSDLDIKKMTVPLFLIEKLTPKFKEWGEVMKK